MMSTSYYSVDEATPTYASQWSVDPMDYDYGEDTSSWAYASQRIAIEQDVVMWHATSFAYTRSPPPAYGVLVDEDEDRDYEYEHRQPQFWMALDPLPMHAPSPPPHNATREPEDTRVVHVLIPAFRGMRVSDADSDASRTPKTKRHDVARTKAQDAMRLKIAKQRGAHARPRPSSSPTPPHPTPRPARRTKGVWTRPSTPATPTPTPTPTHIYTNSRPTSSLHTPSPFSSISSDLQTPPAAARERVPTIVVPGGRSVAWATTQLGHMSLIPAEQEEESYDEEPEPVALASMRKWKGKCRMVSPPDAGSDRTDSEEEGDRKPVLLRVSKEQRRKAMEVARAEIQEREEKEARRRARAEKRAAVMAARRAESALNAAEGVERPPHRKHRRAERERGEGVMMPYRRGETATRLENMKKRIALELQVR